jgi:hypothetical protein
MNVLIASFISSSASDLTDSLMSIAKTTETRLVEVAGGIEKVGLLIVVPSTLTVKSVAARSVMGAPDESVTLTVTSSGSVSGVRWPMLTVTVALAGPVHMASAATDAITGARMWRKLQNFLIVPSVGELGFPEMAL